MPENELPQESQKLSNSPPESGGDDRATEVGDVHLIYKIEGAPSEVPIFELARTLDALGQVVQEADRVINRDKHRLVIKVRPFREGSWLMDLAMSIQSHPEFLFFLAQPEAAQRIHKVLEYLGLIKKAKDAVATVLDVIRHLKDGTPDRVEAIGDDRYSVVKNGQDLVVNGTVHQLCNNVTIQNFIYPAIGAPMQRKGIKGVSTYLPDETEYTMQFLPRAELSAIKAYSEPEPAALRGETIENTTVEFLNPKAGTYGDTEGSWTFSRAGLTAKITARITDEKFLAKFQRGSVRFFQNDLLKVRLKQEQTLKNGKVKRKYEIVEVMEYTKAPVRRRIGTGID